MARTKKNKPGGARRQKDAASGAKQRQAPASAGGRPDGERPAKKLRVERGAGSSSKPTSTSHKARDAEREQGSKIDRPKKEGPAEVVPTRRRPEHEPTRAAGPPPVEQLEQPSPKAGLASSLAKTHDVLSLSVISSSHIQKKVSRVISHISTPTTGKPPLAILTAKAGVASKAITIAEISKRAIANEGGTWFQYSGVEGVLGELASGELRSKGEGGKAGTTGVDTEGEGTIEPEATAGSTAEATEGGVDGDGEEEEGEEEAFEPMRDLPTTSQSGPEYPSVIEHEQRKKVRAVPVITIYLSPAQVGELKKEYG